MVLNENTQLIRTLSNELKDLRISQQLIPSTLYGIQTVGKPYLKSSAL